MTKRSEPRLRILVGQATALGPGKANLLEAINETGSISAAARQMGMSYRRAWNLVHSMNKDFVGTVIETNSGGKGGGGRKDFAQAGGSNKNKIKEAFEALSKKII